MCPAFPPLSPPHSPLRVKYSCCNKLALVLANSCEFTGKAGNGIVSLGKKIYILLGDMRVVSCRRVTYNYQEGGKKGLRTCSYSSQKASVIFLYEGGVWSYYKHTLLSKAKNMYVTKTGCFSICKIYHNMILSLIAKNKLSN